MDSTNNLPVWKIRDILLSYCHNNSCGSCVFYDYDMDCNFRTKDGKKLKDAYNILKGNETVCDQ